MKRVKVMGEIDPTGKAPDRTIPKIWDTRLFFK